MDFNTTTAVPCVLKGLDTPDPCDDGGDLPAACLDLEYAANNPDLCPNSSLISGLVIIPPNGECEVGGNYQFRSYLTFANGKRKDVTSTSMWKVGNGSVAFIGNGGKATGITEGQVTIEATYAGMAGYPINPVLVAFAQLNVVPVCTINGIDFAMVFDRSGSMAAVGPDGLTRMASTLLASKVLVDNMKFEKDQAAVISFAGIFRTPASANESSTTIHTTLTSNTAGVLTAINSIIPNWSGCLVDDPVYLGRKMSICATGIGGGLQVAYDELMSGRHIIGNRRTVVLLTDGAENICNPLAQPVAAAMRAAGCDIVVIALAITNSNLMGCPEGYPTIFDYLAGLTTCGLFFIAPTVDDLPDIYARLPNAVCTGANTNPCFYPVPPPYVPPTPPPTTLLNFDIVPETALAHVGGVGVFKANIYYSSYEQDVSSESTWTSSNTGVATVGINGVVFANAPGIATIKAVYAGTASSPFNPPLVAYAEFIVHA